MVLALGVVGLLAFPVAARLAADGEPIAPVTDVALPALHGGLAVGQVRGLPVFVALSSARVASVVAGGNAGERRVIDGRIRELFGPRLAREIGRGLGSGTVGGPAPFPRLPALAPAQANDLAALLIIAGATSTTGQGKSTPAFPSAGELALYLLRQAVARGGGCAPQLNLAFLWASDSTPSNDPAVSEYLKAARVCPSDPTPLWALGEYQLQLDVLGGGAATDPGPFTAFRRMERTFPNVAASWAGEGDAEMVAGYQLLHDGEPFTARQRFARARALYQRAVELQPNFENRAGLARALAALGDVGAAIATQRWAVAGDPTSAELQARLLDYLQRNHRFAEAADVAAKLGSVYRFPTGVELFASPPSDEEPVVQEDLVGDEDVRGPLSTGVGQMQPSKIVVIPEPQVASGVSVTNLSFFPAYRPMEGIGGTARWCPAWSRVVDLLLSGNPANAVSDFTPRLVDLRPAAEDCVSVLDRGPRELAAVAELELGHLRAALRLAPRRTSLSDLEDLRQNLWRYAGNLPRAAEAARQWAGVRPNDALAIQRQGEIAFLRKLYNRSAAYFAIVVNRARLQYGYWSEPEANGLLDEGTALAYAGRRAEALATLGQANEAAARWGGISGRRGGKEIPAELSAFAMEQAGDTLLDSGHPLLASEDYAVAADAEKQAPDVTALPGAVPLVSDALDNNAAIADIAIGDPATGQTLAAKATTVDPGNPIYWWTEAEAQQHLGHQATAIADYRTSLALDPTEYPVANNLGVLLMQRGDNSAAVAALRRSVGSGRGYATGWFNLGVALDRLGPWHVAAYEGSLARARQLDPKLVSRGPVPLFDNVTYQSHLDLSRPLPANWTFASTQTSTSVAAAGLSVILVLAFGLARTLAARATPGGAEKWFDVIAALDRKMPSVPILRAPALGILATAAFLLWPLHSGPTDGWAATASFAIGLLILIAVVMRVRQLAATREHISLRQETWPPSVAFGLVVTLAGAGWSPLPVARAEGEATGVHWAGPTAVGLLAVVLLVLATWLSVPIARSLGAAGLVMAASLLTPVKPIDGATVSTTALGALPSVAVLGAAALMLAGVL